MATSPAALSARERDEAISLLQYESDTGVFIDDAELQAVAHAVRLARRVFPDGHDITVRWGTGIRLRLTDSAAHHLTQRLPVGWHHTLGLAAVDSLHAALGVTRVAVHTWGLGARRRWILIPAFPRPVYRNAVASLYYGIPAVQVDAELLAGDGGGLSLARTATGYRVGFSRKWGDCLAGCIHKHHWVFDVNLRTRRVTKIRDDGDPWPIPPAA